MYTMPGRLSGIRIYESIHAVRKTDIPNKIHVKRRSASKSYHNRVQKKWIRRWGYVMEPCFYKAPQGIICHPQVRRELELSLARHAKLATYPPPEGGQ